MNAVTLQSLRLKAGSRTLVSDLNLSMNQGENWAVLGPNGSGKSTLLRALAGLDPNFDGRIQLHGEDVRHMDRVRRAQCVSLLLQDLPSTLPASVFDVVMTGRHPYASGASTDSAEDRARVSAILNALDLLPLAGRTLSTLSGGERRRAEIAAVLVQDTSVCLYDEPTLHLDIHHQVEVLRRLAERRDALNIFVLHDLNLAHRFCQNGILLFGDGSCRAGAIETLLDPDHLERAYGCAIRVVNDGSETYFFPQ